MISKSKDFLKQLPVFFVATLILLNGIMNVVLAIIRTMLAEKAEISHYSNWVSYIKYNQTGFIVTIVIGLILMSLAIGLYRRQKRTLYHAVVMLVFLVIINIYPSFNLGPFLIDLASVIVLISSHSLFRRKTLPVHPNVYFSWLILIAALAYGSVGCYLLRDNFKGITTFVDALYYTFVTYSTVGYGDIIPITHTGRLFVITMIVIGIGSFITVLTVLVGPMIKNHLKGIFKMVESLSHFQKHAVICGVNTITLQIGMVLSSLGTTVIFVDEDKDLLDAVEGEKYERYCGNALEQKTLDKVGVKYAKYLICGFNEEAKNILLTMIARGYLAKTESQSRLKIITLLEHEANIENAKKNGADEVIIPAVLCSHSFQAFVSKVEA